ncbi:MAG: DNA translocase FtsK [Nitrospirae bacterium]|nr:DNA translocase FtsK [Nitrospirota bacterium]
MKFFDFLSQSRKNEIWGVFLLALSIFIFLSLFSFTPDDISFYTSPPNIPSNNYAGWLGAHLAFGLLLSFGLASYLIPFLTGIWSLSKFRGIVPQRLPIKFGGIILVLIASSAFLALRSSIQPGFTLKDLIAAEERGFQLGGIVGYSFSNQLTGLSGDIGAYLIVAVFFALGILLATELSFTSLVVYLSRKIKTIVVYLVRTLYKFFAFLKGMKRKKKIKIERKRLPPKEKLASALPLVRREKPKPQPQPQPQPLPSARGGAFQLPPLSFLNLPPRMERGKEEDVSKNSKLLEDTLKEFGVKTKVVQVNEGPVITSYELELAPGVKVSSITSLADDISLALKTPSVRILAPIPGKSVVGIEIPNPHPCFVYLREILSSKESQEASSKLTLALGKDVRGNALLSNLAEMPHLLIAGTTGSGKTVCINSIIISLLYRATPEEVKFLMIDPKRVELVSFDGIPHLISPVVTDTKKASSALKWVIEEMEGRYKLLAQVGARNIDRYNKIRKDPEPLPYIVVIIDELADLMAVAQATVEEAISRLAQLSRAVGIHLILATQRPSVDVITGVIKANFPYRISFQVASKVDSRTVLDMNGAERLLGKGDMLFLPAGLSKPIRAQGSRVSDQAIEKVVDFLKSQQEPEYREGMFEKAESNSYPKQEEDELFERAVRTILESGQASSSTLQRRFRIGYNRAARLIDRMEAEGIIGPPRGSKPRQILTHSPEFMETEENELA